MSTGKRLAKRSIIGTRVVALGDDGKYYSGMIQAVKTPASFLENNNCINLTPNTRYTVRFDSNVAVGKKHSREYRDAELIGPGFRSIGGVRLLPGQRVFLTHNGREVSGEVKLHAPEHDDLLVEIQPVGTEMPIELKKRLDEVRLLESRKSARLADVDTDFARLADMAGDRRRVSTTIDVPSHAISGGEPVFEMKSSEDYAIGSNAALARSRKRRPSNSGDFGYGGGEGRDDMMDECNAALVLMSLSCSPNSPRGAWGGRSSVSPGGSSSSRGSWRSSTPSPPPASISLSDEGIAMDYHMDDDDVCHQPRKKKINRMVYECTWRGCGTRTYTWSTIEAHIRNSHLGPKKEDESDHEEEFYYTEREVSPPPPPPTMSHRDMCRPPHEDPDYQRQLVGSYRQGLLSTLQNQQNSVITQTAGPISIPSQTVIQHARAANSHSPKHMKMSPSYAPYPMSGSIAPTSPGRRRSDNKKCRKVYGMEHRELWCTQCKWKKACSRFGE